jgi:hypothetical protein
MLYDASNYFVFEAILKRECRLQYLIATRIVERDFEKKSIAVL